MSIYISHILYNNPYPEVHFEIPYITSDLGSFLSPYITFESNIWLFEARILLLKVIYGLFGARILL